MQFCVGGLNGVNDGQTYLWSQGPGIKVLVLGFSTARLISVETWVLLSFMCLK